MQGNLEVGALNTNLSLKPPAATQQTIEFNQVFKLQLSQRFYNLYKACYQQSNPPAKVNAALMAGGQYVANNLRLIDLRPNRWHYELDQLTGRLYDLSSDLNALTIDKAILSKALKELRNDRFGAKKEQYDATEKTYYSTIKDIESYKKAIQKIKSILRSLVHEISAAGYYVTEQIDKIDDIDKLTVAIFKPIAYDGQPPVQDKIDDATLNDDKLWGDLVNRLVGALLDETKPLITASDKKAVIKEGIEQVKSKDGNRFIANKKAEYQERLDDLDRLIVDLSKPAESTEEFKKMLDDLIAQSTPKIDQLTQQKNALMKIQADITNWVYQRIREKFPLIYNNWYTAFKKGGQSDSDADYNALSKVSSLRPQIVGGFWNTSARENGFPDFKNLCDRIASTGNELAQYQAQQKTDVDLATKNYTDKIAKELSSKIAEKAALELEFANYDATALQLERAKFFSWWNNPDHYDVKSNINDKNPGVKIEPDSDPLADFYSKINSTRLDRNSPYQIHRFNYQAGEYYTDSGLSLTEFMELPDLANKVAIFPHVDEHNNISSELFVAVVSPRKPSVICEVQFPTFKVIETHQLHIRWDGFALSALAETINLFPNEKKQIVVERQTKLTRTVNQSRSQKTDESRHISSSFENNLTNELSTADNLSYSEERTQKSSRSNTQSNKNSSEQKNESSDDNSADVSASGKIFDIGVDAKAKTSSSRKKSATQSQSKENALTVSESNDGQVLNKSARDTATKNIQNTVSKVATETSNNNQVEVTSSSSEQYEESASNKESIQLENPNSGRTINYNLFQVQNIYKGNTQLKDVKIVINTGLELVEGTGIVGKRVLELEEFNKLYKYTDQSDMAKVLCAFLARRILKNYTGLADGNTANIGMLRLKTGKWDDQTALVAELSNIYKMLDLTLPLDSASVQSMIKFSALRMKSPAASQPIDPSKQASTSAQKKAFADKLSTLTVALARLQKLSFEFNEPKEQAINSEQTYVVNAPAYHVDAQLGQLPATEPYLEERRAVKLEMARAKVDQIKSSSKQTNTDDIESDNTSLIAPMHSNNM